MEAIDYANRNIAFVDPISTNIEGVTTSTKQLSRIVFDDLFENDLLGFLLSSHHFHKHLLRMALRSDPFTARHIQQVICNPILFQEFHTSTLEMYSGVYIEECRHKVHTELMLALDEKFSQSECESSGVLDVAVEAPNRVELAWHYRNMCNGGASLSQKNHGPSDICANLD